VHVSGSPAPSLKISWPVRPDWLNRPLITRPRPVRQCSLRSDICTIPPSTASFYTKRDTYHGVSSHFHSFQYCIHFTEPCCSLLELWYVHFPWQFNRAFVGGLVHGEVAQRAKYLFTLKNNPVNGTESVDEFSARVSQWLQRYESSVLAGMFMPDWYFNMSAHVG
jgi:hypothetical protein